jgi:hypothetical protein
MFRCVITVLLVGWFTFSLCAETPQTQMPQAQVPAAEQKSSEQKSSDQKAPGQATTPADSGSLPAATATTTNQNPLDQFQNFSAIVNGGPLPGMNVDRYIYRSGNMMRMQGDDSVPNYFVTDLSKRESHMIAADGCMKLDSPYTRSFPFFLSQPNVTYERIPIGEENVDGHSCRVEDIKVHDPKNPVLVHIRLYEAEDLQGFPVKIENRREHAYAWVIRYKDVKIEPQDPSLFIFPQHCQTMEGFKKAGPASTPKKATPKSQ